jgi:uncharacterized protein
MRGELCVGCSFFSKSRPRLPNNGPLGTGVNIATQKWERQWAMATHGVIALAPLLLPVFPPFMLWLMRRRESPFVDDHGREAMNVQLSVVVYISVGMVIGPFTCGVLFVLVAVGIGLGIWAGVCGMIAAYRGQLYRAPVTLRIIGPAVLPDSVFEPVARV